MFVCSSLYTQFQRYSGPNANMKFFNENYQKYVNFSHFISSHQLGYFFSPNALMRGKNADSIFTAFLLFVNYGSYSFHLSKKKSNHLTHQIIMNLKASFNSFIVYMILTVSIAPLIKFRSFQIKNRKLRHF